MGAPNPPLIRPVWHNREFHQPYLLVVAAVPQLLVMLLPYYLLNPQIGFLVLILAACLRRIKSEALWIQRLPVTFPQNRAACEKTAFP